MRVIRVIRGQRFQISLASFWPSAPILLLQPLSFPAGSSRFRVCCGQQYFVPFVSLCKFGSCSPAHSLLSAFEILNCNLQLPSPRSLRRYLQSGMGRQPEHTYRTAVRRGASREGGVWGRLRGKMSRSDNNVAYRQFNGLADPSASVNSLLVRQVSSRTEAQLKFKL